MFSYFYYNGCMAKRKKKVVQIDEVLQEKISSYPKVKNAPAGYPTLLGIKGRTWYERAINYERKYNKPVPHLDDIATPENDSEDNINMEKEDGRV